MSLCLVYAARKISKSLSPTRVEVEPTKQMRLVVVQLVVQNIECFRYRRKRGQIVEAVDVIKHWKGRYIVLSLDRCYWGRIEEVELGERFSPPLPLGNHTLDFIEPAVCAGNATFHDVTSDLPGATAMACF